MLFEDERQRLLAEFREKVGGYVGQDGANLAFRMLSELSVVGPAIIDTIH